ncbi:MAG: ABC transporter substrate-binding protein [Sneathiellales bacterium]|nr:ABC transporter substrate-binding protein [Sneathiellales bacterium]
MRSFVLGLLLSLLSFTAYTYPIQVEDVTGRTVTIKEPVTRYVLSEGRYLAAMSVLHPDNPVQGIVGMMSPVFWTHPHIQMQLMERYPEKLPIPLFGNKSAASVSVEKIIDLKPQVAIFGLRDHGPGADAAELISQLEATGTAVIFIDFRSNPLKNTVASMKILGKVFNEEAKAKAYTDFYENRLNLITERVKTIKSQKPKVFLQVHAGRFECCWGMADGMLGPFVDLVGGQNIANAVAPGPTAQHTEEFLLIENPDVWISTASGTLPEFQKGSDVVAMGAGMTAEMSQKSLAKYLSQDAFQALDAVQKNRAHAFWHNFYNSPFNIVAVEALAKWIHPDLFADLNPSGSLEEIYNRFLPFDLNGTYFVTYQNDK